MMEEKIIGTLVDEVTEREIIVIAHEDGSLSAMWLDEWQEADLERHAEEAEEAYWAEMAEGERKYLAGATTQYGTVITQDMLDAAYRITDGGKCMGLLEYIENEERDEIEAYAEMEKEAAEEAEMSRQIPPYDKLPRWMH